MQLMDLTFGYAVDVYVFIYWNGSIKFAHQPQYAPIIMMIIIFFYMDFLCRLGFCSIRFH